jgi:hypothetical protein
MAIINYLVTVLTERTTRQVNSSKGGLKGGVARMDSLTAAEKSELAKKAAAVRWKKH